MRCEQLHFARPWPRVIGNSCAHARGTPIAVPRCMSETIRGHFPALTAELEAPSKVLPGAGETNLHQPRFPHIAARIFERFADAPNGALVPSAALTRVP